MRADEIRVEVFSNITDNHVRMTHLPTGKRAECGRHASQLKNREEALKNLIEKVGTNRIPKGSIRTTTQPISVDALLT